MGRDVCLTIHCIQRIEQVSVITSDPGWADQEIASLSGLFAFGYNVKHRSGQVIEGLIKIGLLRRISLFARLLQHFLEIAARFAFPSYFYLLRRLAKVLLEKLKVAPGQRQFLHDFFKGD